jgi:hypothetical protein
MSARHIVNVVLIAAAVLVVGAIVAAMFYPVRVCGCAPPAADPATARH